MPHSTPPPVSTAAARSASDMRSSVERVVELDPESSKVTDLRASVVIAAYDAAEHVVETLDSLAAQTLSPYEIIVVDDGSTDRTAALATEHPVGATVIRTPNRGMCAARNDGIEAASGELICILDSDDLWHPWYVERMTSLMRRHPEAGSGFGRYRAWQCPAESPPGWESEIDDADRVHDLESFLDINRGGLPVLPSFQVTRRETLLQIGSRPFREDQVQGEAAFLLALVGALAPVVEHVAPIGRYRMHAGAMTGNEMDAARRIEPCIDDLREAARGGLGLDLQFDVATRKIIDRHACDWYRRCGRRLGGGGAVRDGRRQLLKAARLGDRKAALMAAASFFPVLSERVWNRGWRPAAVQRASATGPIEVSRA